MNSNIEALIRQGKLVLLLGAGASLSSKDSHGRAVLSGEALAKLLAEEAGMKYTGEALPIVYGGVINRLRQRLSDILEERFMHCKPADELVAIAKLPWARIYTLNIDDAFDVALRKYSPQNVNMCRSNSKIRSQDQVYRNLEFIKLNGSVDAIEDGLIFSVRDYGIASASSPLWYQELAVDFSRFSFLFVGTKLNEPLFYHHVERYKIASRTDAQISYVLTPEASELEVENLREMGINHIHGDLEGFSRWLTKVFPAGLGIETVACERNPALRMMVDVANKSEQDKLIKTFQYVKKIDRANLSVLPGSGEEFGKIRDFYRGFKPGWTDIVQGVPAELESLTSFYTYCASKISDYKNNLVMLCGPAGSGKSTLLKQVVLRISDNKSTPVYFVSAPVDNIFEIIQELEKTAVDRYIVAYDRVSEISNDLEETLQAGVLKKGVVIACESLRVWERRVREHLGRYCGQPFILGDITEKDAFVILNKIQRYGPWSLLSKMRPRERLKQLLVKSKRQLLIGLLETVSGRGFEEIIENDYLQIQDDEEKAFIILVALATVHKMYIKRSYVLRSMNYIGYGTCIDQLLGKLAGIIHCNDDRLEARHPLYARHLLTNVVTESDLFPVLLSLIKSYTVYDAPVLKNVPRDEALLYRSVINHRFLKNILREDFDKIINLYRGFEKYFEADGLYWLQYGLALRDMGLHQDAYDKISTACIIHSHPHTEHALAQQELLLALSYDSRDRALPLYIKAKERLEKLNRTLVNDSYPLVTLAEGALNFMLKFEGADVARRHVKEYANEISRRLKGSVADSRLQHCWKRITTFSVTGVLDVVADDDEYFVF